MVKFQIRSEGCRAVSCRVADSLFRPHPEQRARASREPKRQLQDRTFFNFNSGKKSYSAQLQNTTGSGVSSFELVQLLPALAEYTHAVAEQSAVCIFFSTSRRPHCVAVVCWFLLRGCVFRPDDACQKRFSWFPDWSQKRCKNV